MPPGDLEKRFRAEALRLGFARVGFARAGACRDRPRLEEWLAAGRHGEMAWMARDVERRTDPRSLVEGARTVIALLTAYSSGPPVAPFAAGRVSRYAIGADYHSLIRRRLRKLARFLARIRPGTHTATTVDFRPVLEREWAERAGLGWIGKHSNLLTDDAGSWFFLSELVTDAEFEPDAAPVRDRCGRCTDCIDACPTGAIVAPRVVDARRCISYLTIELRSAIPRELRALVGDWIFGCDVCQDVCPWNRFAAGPLDARFDRSAGRFDGDPAGFLSLSVEAFEARFRGSPVRRAGRDGFLRNLCVALGNRGDATAVPALARALAQDASPLVRGHAAWALGRIGGPDADAALRRSRAAEADPFVAEEIEAALAAAEGRDLAAPPPSRSTGFASDP